MTGSVWSSPLGSWLRGLVDDPASALPSLSRVVETVRQELDKVPALGVLFVRMEQWGAARRLFGWDGVQSAYDTLTSLTLDMVGSGLRRLDLPADLGLRSEGFAIILSAARSGESPTLAQVDAVAERLAVAAREHLAERLPVELADRLSVDVGAGLIPCPDSAGTLERVLIEGLAAAEEAARAKQARRLEELRAHLQGVLEAGPLGVLFQPIVESVSGGVVGFDVVPRGPGFLNLEYGDVLLDVAGRTALTREAYERYHEAALVATEGILGGRDLLVLRTGVSELVAGAVRVMSQLYGRENPGLTPANVVFLVDTAELAAHFPISLAAFRSVEDMGFRLAVDVFSDGLLPLDQLHELNVDLMRVGGRMVHDVQRRQDEFELLLMLTRFAGRHGARVLAADCRQRAEVAALRKAGVNLLQGEYFAPGLPQPVRPEVSFV
ncbi:MAG: EAL domain-containing protein [Actinobacteria bacterium]|nr:EAL domain-containing protein [Actinomycetota bacterium]